LSVCESPLDNLNHPVSEKELIGCCGK